MAEILDLTWHSAVLSVLKNHHPHEINLQDIYLEVGKYRKLKDWELEYTKYEEPRFQHIVRATLNHLLIKGLVERIRRGVYVLKIEERRNEH